MLIFLFICWLSVGHTGGVLALDFWLVSDQVYTNYWLTIEQLIAQPTVTTLASKSSETTNCTLDLIVGKTCTFTS